MLMMQPSDSKKIVDELKILVSSIKHTLVIYFLLVFHPDPGIKCLLSLLLYVRVTRKSPFCKIPTCPCHIIAICICNWTPAERQ